MATALQGIFPLFRVEILTLVMGMAASLLVGLLAAVFPATKAVRTPIVDGLRIVD